MWRHAGEKAGTYVQHVSMHAAGGRTTAPMSGGARRAYLPFQNQKEINLLMFISEAEINEWCFGALVVREFHWHAAVPGTVPARPSFGGFTGPCLISTLS